MAGAVDKPYLQRSREPHFYPRENAFAPPTTLHKYSPATDASKPTLLGPRKSKTLAAPVTRSYRRAPFLRSLVNNHSRLLHQLHATVPGPMGRSFLQPALSPYNIAEKVQEANRALFDESCDNSTREQRVRFSETLVDFEPDLTDDDVQSIESYNGVADYSVAEDPMEELKYVIQNNDKDMYNILEEVEEVEEVVEEEEKIIEEIDEDSLERGSVDEVKSLSDEETAIPETTVTQPNPKPTNFTTYPIDCKQHCIEELDSRLELCINNLYLNSNKPTCPPLKLQKRLCCENQCKEDQKLPMYTGLRSEYGLSSSQIERREKRIEVIRRKQEKERQLQEEYRRRKIQQNEIIFCQWLRDIANRKLAEDKVKERKKEVKSFSARPSVGAALVPQQAKRRRRPHTTGTCVYIEVAPNLLRTGIHIGDIGTRKKKSPNNLHVFVMT